VALKTIKQLVELNIRPATRDDVPALVQLHQRVSEEPGALIRQKEEITTSYMEGVFQSCADKGLMLMASHGDDLIGEIHAYTPNIRAFRHLLSELTIVVHPEQQGKGIGRLLFEAFLKTVMEDFPHILRVELYTREHNEKTVAFYSSLGFRKEGRQENKIQLGENRFHTPIHMAWFNPNYLSK